MDFKSDQSNPSIQRIWYEVFLSFRGEDTRNNFIDHLYAALQRSGIFAFKDDQRLNKGDTISTELFKAISESRISIVVFSKKYADSTWCLRELARIVYCHEKLGQSVLPIFYDVDPSEVRKQSGNYGEAFAQHEKSFKENLDMVKTWRAAMSKIANVTGWNVRNKPESEVIDEIVQNAISMLGYKFSSLADDLIGIQSRVEALEKLLDLNSVDNVRVVGITGMGGIGKTTLAAVVYDKISCQFDACSFLMDVSTGSKGDGLFRLQKQLLSETLKEKGIEIWNLGHGTSRISSRLKNLKTLLVLDNVNLLDELENLAKRSDWFGAGSRVIITTRNEHILNHYGVNDIYRVEPLTDTEALELLCRKSFKDQNPMSDYEELTHRALIYVKGLPLAAKVLGSCLCNKSVSYWESTLARLQENPEKEIMDVLQTSFDVLPAWEQEIFLDIACFFCGMCTDDVKRILDSSGFYAESGITNLIDKSLLNIINKEVHMHDLLQQLGKKIVQEHFPKRPEKWSRLWLYKDFYHVMMERKVVEDIEGIVLDSMHAQETGLRDEGLSNFSHLRLLIFRYVNFFGSLRSLSRKLKYLEWRGYPFTYLPSNFQLDELVELVMPYSHIRQLWEGLKPLHNLRRMNLKHSKYFIMIPDFNGFPNLERLDLEGCTRLLKLDESIGVLGKLTFLNLKDCKNLVSIPDCIFCLSSLDTLCLSGCSRLQMQLKRIEHDEEVDGTRQSILSIVCKHIMLPFHMFSERHNGILGLSRDPFLGLPSLRKLDLSYCNVREISNSIGCLHCLEDLNLSGNNFITLSSMNKLSKLQFLSLEDCEKLQSLPTLPSNITSSLKLTGYQSDSFTGIEGYLMGPLRISNCPMFTDIEGCSSLALSWLIKFFEEKPLQDCVCTLVGSEIPKWMKYQSLGSSMRIQVPPNAHLGDSNCLGIAICILLVKLDFDGYSSGIGLSLNGMVMLGWVFTNVKRFKVGSSNLLLFFYTRELLVREELLKKETAFIDVVFKYLEPFDTKKCGMRWVYKKGVERLKQSVIHSGGNIQIDDDDDLEVADSFLKDYLHGEIGSG